MFEQIYSQNLQICLCGHICRKYALKINRVQKQQNLKGCFVMDEKKFHTQEFQPKGISRNMISKLLQKMSTGKTTVFQTLAAYCHWKRYFSELNRRIFQISLKVYKVSYFKNTLCTGIMQFYFLLQNYVTSPTI